MAQIQNRKSLMILIATILVSASAVIMNVVVIVALPTIQSSLNATINQIQWVVGAYAICLSSLILVSGSLGDIYGRKRVFVTGIIIFVIGAILSSTASNIQELIIFQAIQGTGAALMIPGSLSILVTNFPIEERGKAIGLWATSSGIITAIGPLAGGWTVENFGWSYIFLLTVPFSILGLLVTMKYIPESVKNKGKPLDIVGIAIIAISLFGISYALISAPIIGWYHEYILISLTSGIIGTIIFFIYENRIENPIVPLKIFKDKQVLGANIITLFVYFSFVGAIFFLSLNFQQIQEYSPSETGLKLMPLVATIILFSRPGGSLVDKFGPKKQLTFSPLLLVAGMLWLSRSGINANYSTDFLPALLLIGTAVGLMIAPITKTALKVDQKYSGAASGVNNYIARISTLLTISVLGLIMISVFNSQLNSLIQTLQIDTYQKQIILEQSNNLAEIKIPDNFTNDAKIAINNIIKTSFVSGFSWIMRVCALIALLASITSTITIEENNE